jgi:poly-beta-1,6-N-acetyl-D-glucosamine synthase
MKWIFWGAAGLTFYAYFGYAACLWLRAFLFPRPVQRGRQEPNVSIAMVVRNEEQILETKMQNLLELDYPAERCQIVAVSDGSTDRTEEILRTFAQNSRVQVVLNQLSKGKASALNDAVGVAPGEIIVFTDARQKIEPQAVRFLMESFADPDVGCVSGELMLGNPEAGETAEGMGLYWRIEKEIRELEAKSGSTVGATGAIYAVRRELVPQVPMGTILDDVYIPMEVVRRGKRVIFEPRARAWDVVSLGAEREFARKVRTLSGNYQLLQLAPWLVSGRNPIRWEFISHKLVRLVVPFALAAILLSSVFLQSPLYRVALILQILFYSLGLLAWLHVGRGPLARMADAALTFVVLNTAALAAFLNFVTGRKAVWTR